MNGLFRGAPGRELFLALVCLGIFAIGAYANGAAAKSGPLFRYVFEKTGREAYAAKPQHRKIQDAKKGIIVQMIGYVYLEPHTDTYPLYGLKRMVLGEPAHTFFTANEAEYQKMVATGQWKSYYDDSPIVCYVRTQAGKDLRAAYRFTQTNVQGDEPRLRFQGAEYDQWAKLDGVKFNSAPDFYIWKDKPVPLMVVGTMNTVPVGVIAGMNFIDLGLRKALYDNTKSGYKLDPSNPYATPGGVLTLYRSNGKSCTPTECEFRLGFYLNRNKADKEFTTVVAISGGVTTVQNSVVFPKGAKSASLTLPVVLKTGKTALTVSLKPYDPKSEINESNNSFIVLVEVK